VRRAAQIRALAIDPHVTEIEVVRDICLRPLARLRERAGERAGGKRPGP
jgi:hypothetical protein